MGMEKVEGIVGVKVCKCEVFWCVRGIYKLFGIREVYV